MKSGVFTISLLATLSSASPLQARQLLDFAVLDAAPQPTLHTESIEEKPHTVQYDLPAATEAAVADPLPVEPVGKRRVKSRTDNTCQPLEAGSGPVPDPDTAASFLASSLFSDAATTAPTPNGYVQTFANAQASSSAYGYAGFSTLGAYDTAECARRCDAVGPSCSGFNIYFERDPSVVPGAEGGCADPPSTTAIKCVYWGGYIDARNANNDGQWRERFRVAVAGSNGYMKTRVPAVDGFRGQALGNKAINAPLNCAGQDTYMGAKVFTTAFFDTGLCAAACLAQNEYNAAHPPADGGEPKICRFFVTYLSQRNGVPEGQYCALYTQEWDASYATNDGQWRGNDHYTNDYVYAYTSSSYTDNTVCST